VGESVSLLREPDAGDPPVRFGGRGNRIQSVLPTPIVIAPRWGWSAGALLIDCFRLRRLLSRKAPRNLLILREGERRLSGRRPRLSLFLDSARLRLALEFLHFPSRVIDGR